MSYSKFKFMLAGLYCLPMVILLRVLRPFVLIRICRIFSERIGHFIIDAAEHLVGRQFKSKRTLDLFFFGRISNEQWAKMVKRSSLTVMGSWMQYLYRWNQIIPGGKIHQISSSETNNRDRYNLFGIFDVALKFTEVENDEAIKWLTSKGWCNDEPFVCLHVRDSSYLNNFELVPGNYDYHSYRDSDINSYKSAINWLCSNNVWVLRMGKDMKVPLAVSSEKFIDYAFDSGKNDLLDIWLFANSSGIISTASGPDNLGVLYRKPLLFVNALRLVDICSWREVLWVPKNLIWKKSGKELTLSEILDCEYTSTLDYESAGIRIVDLTADEILHSVKEFWQNCLGTNVNTPLNQTLQEKFHYKLSNSVLFWELHASIHRKCQLGAYWLSTKSNEFFE